MNRMKPSSGVVTMIAGRTRRADAQVEVGGLDIPERVVPGGRSIVMDKASGSPVSKQGLDSIFSGSEKRNRRNE